MYKPTDIVTGNEMSPAESDGAIRYAYTYGGHKFLKETELEGEDPETRLYLGGAEFVNGQPESYYHGEGRVALTDSVPRFQYKLTDHLGNTMVLFEDKDGDGIITTESMSTDPAAVEVLQRNFYYAFGLPMQGPWNHTPTDPDMPYLYNGKELEGELGLGWYAYGFRYYDASVGRFVGVDPIASQFPHVSVFNYAENEPVGHIDLWGLQKVTFMLIGEFKSTSSAKTTPVGISMRLDIGDNNRLNLAISSTVFSVGAQFSSEHGWSFGIGDGGALIKMNENMREGIKGGLKVPSIVSSLALRIAIGDLSAIIDDLDIPVEHQDLLVSVLSNTLTMVANDLEKGTFNLRLNYDGTEDFPLNSEGKAYSRKFTWSATMSMDELYIMVNETTNFEGKAALQYTQQDCLQNCNE
jgi:RHS repeat-associated protein